MKKGLTFVAVAALTFALGDLLFGVAADGLLRHSGFRFAKLYTGRLQGDILVFGNSRAVNGFCVSRLSERTGAKWVNLGYNGLGPALVEALALDYLDRHPAPRAIVLEVSNVTQGSDSIRDCRLFASQSHRLAELDRMVKGSLGWLARHCRTFAANGEMLLRCLYYLGRSDQGWVNEGQLDVKNAEALKAEAGQRLEGAMLPDSVTVSQRLIKELRQRNIEVWCVVTPYLLAERDHRYAASWLDPLRASADDGVHFVNLVGAISDPRLYADPSHLNRAGSEAFAEVLAHEVFSAAPEARGSAGERGLLPATVR